MIQVKMSREVGDAFEAHLNEHPHDKTGHLVYADWLDENGKPEAAATHRAFALKKKSPFALSSTLLPGQDTAFTRRLFGNQHDAPPAWGAIHLDGVNHTWSLGPDDETIIDSESHDPKSLYDFFVGNRDSIEPRRLKAKVNNAHSEANNGKFQWPYRLVAGPENDWHQTPEGRNFFNHFALVQESDHAMHTAAQDTVARSRVDPAVPDPEGGRDLNNPEYVRRVNEMTARMRERYRPFIEQAHPLTDPSTFRTLADLLRDNEAHDPEFMRHILDNDEENTHSMWGD
jgi:uncharacterized protein (TIGR02996 family)